MRNLEQIRAANAWEAGRTGGAYAGPEGGEVVKKIPSYIRTNGLLAAMAFALELKAGKGAESKGYRRVFDDIAKHLSHGEIGLVRSTSAENLLRELCESDSTRLRLVTAEAMAYLSYLRRFQRRVQRGE